MQYILIDLKGNNSNLLHGIKDLSEEDIVCIMYSSNSNSLSFQAHFELMNSKAKIIYYNIANSKFLVASQLGYVIREYMEKNCKFSLVAEDAELSSLVNFWKSRGIAICLRKKIAADEARTQQTADPGRHISLSADPRDFLSDYPADYIPDFSDDLSRIVPVEEYATLEPAKIPEGEDWETGRDDTFFDSFKTPF